MVRALGRPTGTDQAAGCRTGRLDANRARPAIAPRRHRRRHRQGHRRHGEARAGLAERAVRGIAIGRGAWLFAGSDRGGEAALRCSPLIETAKLNDVDPQAWLADGRGLGNPTAHRHPQGAATRWAKATHGRRSIISTASAIAGSTGSRVTNIRTGDPDLSCLRHIAGERNAPPEDCGGIPGFYQTLDAAAGPTHPSHAEAKKWLDDYDAQPHRRAANQRCPQPYRQPAQRCQASARQQETTSNYRLISP